MATTFLPRRAIASDSGLSFEESLLRHRDVSNQTVRSARDLVAASIREQSAYNKYRFENPRRNNYRTQQSAPTAGSNSRKRDSDDGPAQPLVNRTIAAAAALLAEIDAAAEAQNGTLFGNYTNVDILLGRPRKSIGKNNKRSTTSSYWLANKENLGSWPYGGDSGFQVFRSVKDYGAAGDGVTVSRLAEVILSNSDRDGRLLG